MVSHTGSRKLEKKEIMTILWVEQRVLTSSWPLNVAIVTNTIYLNSLLWYSWHR